jgi:hypothetical protein
MIEKVVFIVLTSVRCVLGMAPQCCGPARLAPVE